MNNKLKYTLKLRKILILYFTLCSFVIFFIFIALNLFGYEVSATDNTYKRKIYTSIEIKEGDTLHSISELYSIYGYFNRNDFYQEIKSINNIRQDCLFIGELLVLPSFY